MDEKKIHLVDDQENKMSLKDYAEKIQAIKNENRKHSKEKLDLTDKERQYLAKMNRKERKKFINKSLGRDENAGLNGPYGKRYF